MAKAKEEKGLQMKKRTIYGMLAALLAVSGLWGCGSAVQEEPVGNTNISLYCDVDFWTPPKWDTGEDTITGKITQETGVELNTTVPSQDAENQVRILLANDMLPDLVTVTNANPTTISQLVSSGKFWNLEDFFDTYLPDAQIVRNFPEDVKQGLIRRDGGWYAWPSHLAIGDVEKIWPVSSPCYADMMEYGSNTGIIWNKKLLRELGLAAEELKTQEQVMQAFGKVREANKDREEPIIPLMLDGQDSWDHSIRFFIESFGAEFVDAEGKYVDFLLQPEAKDGLRYLNQIVQKGIVQAEQMTLSNAQIRKLIADGTVLCFVGNTANIDIVATDWVSSGPILPASGKHPVYGREREVGLGWLNTFISRDCEHPQELAEFLDYMTSPAGMFLWEFGEEGVHYVMEDGLVKVTPEGKEAERDYGNTGVAAWWMFQNTAWKRSVLAPFEEGSAEDADARLRIAYGKAEETRQYNSSLLSFSMGELEQDLDGELTAYKKNQVLKVILSRDDAQFEQEYQAMLDGLEEMGIHKLDAEKNAQYQKNCREQKDRIRKVN